MFKLKKIYNLHCKNTHYPKKYWWRIAILHCLAVLFNVRFEIEDVKFGTSTENHYKHIGIRRN